MNLFLASKKLKNNLSYGISKLYWSTRLLTFTNGFYGPEFLTEVSDQLANPDKNKVEQLYGNINDAKAAMRFGTNDLKEYSFWSWRSCGIALIQTVLNAKLGKADSLFAIAKEIDASDGYLHRDKWGRTDIGWKYKSLAKYLLERGIPATILPQCSLEHVLFIISTGKIAICSIQSRLGTGSHMVLVTNWKKDSHGIMLTVHDPFYLDGKGGKKELSFNEFNAIFLKRAISIG